jgi:superfamily II DNA or RNA helicase
VASFLDVLTGDTLAMRACRERLCHAAATPRTVRDLRVLVRALQPRPARPDELQRPYFGWLLKMAGGRLKLVPVRASLHADAGHYRVKEVGRDGWGLAARPADDAVEASPTLVTKLMELVGHPYVFVREGRSCDGRPRRVRRKELGLGFVYRDDDGSTQVRLEVDGRPVSAEELAHPYRVDRHWWVWPGGGREICVAYVSEAVERVHELLSQRGELRVPDGGALLEQLPDLDERVPLRADPRTLGPPQRSDGRPVLCLSYDQESEQLDLAIRFQPLPDGPLVTPGVGSAVVVAHREHGHIAHTVRCPEAEVASAQGVAERLGLPDEPHEPWQWRVEGLQHAFDVVDAARGMSQHVQIRWGGKRPVLALDRANLSQLEIGVSKQRDWFDVSGRVRVGGEEVPLSKMMKAAARGERWVPLSENQWVKVSEGLHAQLTRLLGLMPGRDDVLRARPVHAELLRDLEEKLGRLDAPPELHEVAARAAEAKHLHPEVPEGLRATLRPYQLEGYQWMARLAHWAPGACLADDMGLGKTLQAITLLLQRREGPALVVAPTSLLTNWSRELERFAPELRVHLHHGSHRRLQAEPGTVTLTTYGVVTSDIDELSKVGFTTVVADEAQAIKNFRSQRSRAIRRLDAGFRLALSGTPIENRTRELWSLFAFIAPDLLGSQADFDRWFGMAIEDRGDEERRELLAQLIAPFVLRRTKAAVAPELPARIEMVEEVALSEAERALYEQARRRAVADSGNDRMRALASLLQLRQLACHPRLADATSGVPSSKLTAVRRRVHALKASGQRCLIFSCFTTHLALVREALAADGLQLRYLDGTLSTRQRLEEVDRFQSGEGDAFLISTGAGGVGLNLTAATAVLHIDPWWNPAVEDQATDRAHRIGQQQPVTVIRFVSAGTIEQKILQLHAEKRELAEGLLAHSASSAPVGLDELMQLMQGGFTHAA